ncbi:MAG TPA: UDP-2,3-diacylglucosamine diphosphatase [Rubricoccaceae bacterium]|jgi:UDP-2,3-diacylglucosamine hydrolase
MTLFLSDLHLGRGTPDATRAAERDAVAVIRAHDAGLLAGGTLVLLGDVFDQYLEYRHLVPKGGPRLVGLLAELADRGVRVLYTVGNRDPWHGDYFEREIGVTVLHRPTRVETEGVGVYLAHGDGHVGRPARPDRARPAGIPSARLLLSPLLRAPLMARLYRMGLPGDAGFGLARWVARRFGSDGAPTSAETAALAAEADRLLDRSDLDVVGFGHIHQAALHAFAGGTYLNPGYWFGDRTFARLDGATGAAELLRWDGRAAVPLARLPLGAPAPL